MLLVSMQEHPKLWRLLYVMLVPCMLVIWMLMDVDANEPDIITSALEDGPLPYKVKFETLCTQILIFLGVFTQTMFYNPAAIAKMIFS